MLEFDANGNYVIERRLAGQPLDAIAHGLTDDPRAVALRNYVEAVEPLATITFPDRPYGQLIAKPSVVDDSWHGYLRRNLDVFATRNAATIAAEFGDVATLVKKAERLLAGIDPDPVKALVHGDYFPGNVLLDESLAVTAVIDFSVFTLVGDPLLDAACALVFLEMNDPFTDADVALVRDVALARFGNALKDAEPFYRAYFAFSLASPEYAQPPYPRLFEWSRRNLQL